ILAFSPAISAASFVACLCGTELERTPLLVCKYSDAPEF
ncbi:unnamed protein product, partial [Allacma fusca]